MKLRKVLTAALALVLLTGTLTMNVSANRGLVYTAPKGTPVIDGEYDDVWATARWTNVHHVWDGKEDSSSRLRIKLLWDDNNLYFYAEVFDEQKNKRNDLIEIYLDQKNDKKVAYGEDDSHTRFYVHQEGCFQGSDTYAGKNHQADAPSINKVIGTNRYAVEGALAFNVVKPAVNNEMGLEFMYNDGSLYEPFIEAYRWNIESDKGEAGAFEETKNWGTLKFGEAGAPLPENTYIDGDKMDLGESKNNTSGDKNNNASSDKNTNKDDNKTNADANKDTNKDTNADANKDTNKDTNADANKDTNKDTNVDADKNVDKDANVSNDKTADADAEKGGMSSRTIAIIAILAVAVVAFFVILFSGKKKKVDATVDEANETNEVNE